jgi:cyclopropane-fatty-acyl-phospholipid synthase
VQAQEGFIVDNNRAQAEAIVRELFALAGIGLEGRAPGDIVVKNSAFYERLLRDASIGLGESFMDEWWDCERLDIFIEKVLRADLKKKIRGSWRMQLLTLHAILFNRQSKARAPEVAHKHYDLGNDLYKVMLDKRMIYTCGYWKNAKNLEEAQEAKLDLVCRKVGLKPGMTVLDLGCGWGGLAIYAAERYGAKVLGVTIAKEQVKLAREMAGNLPCEFRLQDYRDVYGKFDRVWSIGLLEHVGHKNHRALMEVVHRNLKDDGIALLHTIGNNESMLHGVPFIEKYIFPNAAAPSIAQLGKAMEGLFVMEDWHNFGPDYTTTLLAWWDNFRTRYHELDQRKYDRRFYRMWQFYLLAAAGAGVARDGQLWHIVLTKPGQPLPDCRLS